jgi:hypothetical protein
MNTRTFAFLIGMIVILTGQSLHAASGMAATTCHIKFVSFGFTGTPGTPISYHGQSYVIPGNGHLELVAQKGDFTFKAAGLTMTLDAETKRDEFGSAAIDVDQRLADARSKTATVQVADASTTAATPRPATF